MSIEQTNVIDFIGTDPLSGSVILTATDHLEWGSGEHLLLIQEKMNSYLAFVESGEVFESYPAAKGKPIKLQRAHAGALAVIHKSSHPLGFPEEVQGCHPRAGLRK